jgi:hypothetical protein
MAAQSMLSTVAQTKDDVKRLKNRFLTVAAQNRH